MKKVTETRESTPAQVGMPTFGPSHAERTTRARVARLILEHGPISASALGQRLGLTPAAVRRHLDHLLGEEMIEVRRRFRRRLPQFQEHADQVQARPAVARREFDEFPQRRRRLVLAAKPFEDVGMRFPGAAKIRSNGDPQTRQLVSLDDPELGHVEGNERGDGVGGVGVVVANAGAEQRFDTRRGAGSRIEEGALAAIVEQTQGYPYFLQEWGKHGWDVAEASPIRAEDIAHATRSALAELDASFFRVRFDRLTPAEKRYLQAMASLGPGPHRSGDIAEALGVKVSSVAPTRNSLITKGMLYSPAHGDTAFTVPLFDAYMRRVMP